LPRWHCSWSHRGSHGTGCMSAVRSS
jgi:hypothetical protein